MNIKIYGSGCPKCKKLEENVKLALKDENKDFEIEKVTDMAKIIDAGIVMTPALEIDGKVISSGKLLTPEELKDML